MRDLAGSRIQVAQQEQPTAGATPGITATDRPGVIIINMAPGGAEPKSTHRGLEDIGGAVQVLIWPLLLLLVAIVFRRTIAAFFTSVASRIKSFSVAGVAIELAQQAQSLFFKEAGVDIRHAGTDNDVQDSTLGSFYEQIRARTPLEFAVVDLGEGAEWLTSRLYILSVILRRMRSLQAVVFVDTAKNVRGHFVGVCASDLVRWRLARAYPKLEAALAAGESRVWSQPNAAAVPIRPQPSIDDDSGRFANSEDAAELLRGFLAAIQKSAPPPGDPGPWQPLGAAIFERAEWLNAPLVEKLLAGALDVEAMGFDAFQLADRNARVRAVVQHRGLWLPLVRADGRFHGLIDRMRVVQSLAVESLSVAST
jgi:hypothetical protein